MSARDEVLARIRSGLATSHRWSHHPPDYRTADDLRPGDPALLDLLIDRLEDYKATVVQCRASEVAEASPPHCRRCHIVVAPGLPADWRPEGAVEDDGRPAVELADYAAAVTGVAVAVAETGTLFLDGSPTSGRRALSLLPDCLVCVVTADQVVGGVPIGLTRVDPVAPLTMISGPSATSDIELERVEGVHGPRTLIVVLLFVTPGVRDGAPRVPDRPPPALRPGLSRDRRPRGPGLARSTTRAIGVDPDFRSTSSWPASSRWSGRRATSSSPDPTRSPGSPKAPSTSPSSTASPRRIRAARFPRRRATGAPSSVVVVDDVLPGRRRKPHGSGTPRSGPGTRLRSRPTAGLPAGSHHSAPRHRPHRDAPGSGPRPGQHGPRRPLRRDRRAVRHRQRAAIQDDVLHRRAAGGRGSWRTCRCGGAGDGADDSVVAASPRVAALPARPSTLYRRPHPLTGPGP